MVDKRAIFWFLFVTFGITYAVEGGLLLSGVSFTLVPPIFFQYAVAVLMWAPTVGAVFTRKVILRESLRAPNARLRVGDLRPYLAIMILMPLAFLAIYALTVVLGLGELDLTLKTFIAQIEAASGQPLPDQPPAATIIAALLFSSIVVAPFVNGLIAFGEEYGWRGFLLPQLLPLGRPRAHLISGIIWGLWHAPLILMGFNYPGFPWLGIVFMCVLTTLLGILENEWTLRYNSTILASLIHGAFNSQAYGVWRIIIVNVNPLLGGFTGLVGFAVLAIIAWWAVAVGRAPRVHPGLAEAD